MTIRMHFINAKLHHLPPPLPQHLTPWHHHITSDVIDPSHLDGHHHHPHHHHQPGRASHPLHPQEPVHHPVLHPRERWTAPQLDGEPKRWPPASACSGCCRSSGPCRWWRWSARTWSSSLCRIFSNCLSCLECWDTSLLLRIFFLLPVLHNVPSLQELQHGGVGRLKQLELLCSASSCPIRVDNQKHPSVCSLDLLFLGQAARGQLQGGQWGYECAQGPHQ